MYQQSALIFFSRKLFPGIKLFIVTAMLAVSCYSAAAASANTNSNGTNSKKIIADVKFWNANKTSSRQIYELAVLKATLDATQATHGKWKLIEDKTEYPAAEDEASIFRSKGFDIFATVAGNIKLANEKKIIIPIPLMKGLLGYRILIIRESDREKFAGITTAEQLQALRLGIPNTWADAGLFRRNGYPVVEKGSFDELFTRLRDKEFDYVSFGANEVDGVFNERAKAGGQLAMESSLLVYYPFPLVFYVNPANPALAERITSGLKIIGSNGVLDALFKLHYGKFIDDLKLKQRHVIALKNPMLPAEMADFKPSVLMD